MKICLFVTAVVLILLVNECKADIILKFKIIDERILVEIPGNSGKMLNFLFDSGSNDFILDSAYLQSNDIIPMPDKNWASAFSNGAIKSTLVSNCSFFKEPMLNKLYPLASMFDIKKLNLKCSVPIDGIIGINNNFKSNWVGIDFVKHELVIAESPPPQTAKGLTILKMIYTDSYHKTAFSMLLHKQPASEVKIAIDSVHAFSTNVLFDTGFNDNFALFGLGNIDSLARTLKKPVVKEEKKKATLVNGLIQYRLEADSLIFDHQFNKSKQKIIMHQVSRHDLVMFGNLKMYGLVGVSFLKKFKLIAFDFLHNQIIINE
jgi:hypothetical protein